jgi:hypothetical protein
MDVWHHIVLGHNQMALLQSESWTVEMEVQVQVQEKSLGHLATISVAGMII